MGRGFMNGEDDGRVQTCYKCGGPNHFARDCHAKSVKCYACGKFEGHIVFPFCFRSNLSLENALMLIKAQLNLPLLLRHQLNNNSAWFIWALFSMVIKYPQTSAIRTSKTVPSKISNATNLILIQFLSVFLAWKLWVAIWDTLSVFCVSELSYFHFSQRGGLGWSLVEIYFFFFLQIVKV